MCLSYGKCDYYAALQSHKAVSAYLQSKRIQPFSFARVIYYLPYSIIQMYTMGDFNVHTLPIITPSDLITKDEQDKNTDVDFTRYWTNVWSMLAQRRRWWADIGQTLGQYGQCLVFAGFSLSLT